MEFFPPETWLMILEQMSYEQQLLFRLSCPYANSLFLCTKTLGTLQSWTRRHMIKQSLEDMLAKMAHFYDRFGCIGSDRFPSFLRRDEALLDYPYMVSQCDSVLCYLANVALLHTDEVIFSLALAVAINLSTEKENTLGCYILKNSKLMNKLVAEVEADSKFAESIVLLLGNCHDHRTHVGSVCPFTNRPVYSSSILSTLARCKKLVNSYHQKHPESDDAEFAADMWNTTPRI